jgi:hypothetical protein
MFIYVLLLVGLNTEFKQVKILHIFEIVWLLFSNMNAA